ncbi:DNA helicase/exodeoxyribonuclease V, beta subunit [Sulfurivirga caldicuralii]|uniref:RecBCD enzyme subunit RecB n=1 Tax=Sulfurivirga caldicuralii TaxID=364032 RepID=A0A1N6HA77_9GAMM|nr:UvrD-helicase domain-containing protein [Sulfurivirga caldicuralii]SIO16682.1 DNA helicase/exodeoxyribonuclease V, beta subunit [Sulfurivirga caldicuralii]
MTAMPLDLYNVPLPPGVHSIEASAGTGKTYTLAQLVVRLVVEQNVPIEQILVVTFTRAAAAELRERIYQRLGEVEQALQCGTTDDAKLLAWLQRQDPEQARTALLRAKMMLDQAAIYTIDSFAMQVAREHALALGLAWDASLIDDHKALDRALVDQLWHGIEQLDDPALRREIVNTWQNPDKLYERFDNLGEGATFTLDSLQTLQQRRAKILSRWTPERLKALGESVAESLYQHCDRYNKGPCNKAVLTPLKNGEFPKLPAKEKTTLETYLRIRLEKAGHTLEETLSSEHLEELLNLSQDLASLPDLHQFVQAWFRDQYTAWQRLREQELDRRGAFTYHSLKHRLAERVGTDASLHEALRQQYQACLIDEFQDTDPDQWRLFSTLFSDSDAHRLFLIGDPKQAIYAFRGANLETYFAATQTAQHRHTLDTNYRSHPTLIDGFNALFAGKNTFMDDRCVYQPVKAGQSQEKTAFALNGEPAERIRIVIGEALSDRKQATLAQLARDVVHTLEKGQLRGKPLRPGNIAILAKSNSDAAAIQQTLRKVNVPSVLTSRDSVWQSDSAVDLLRLLQAILTPTHRDLVRAALIGPYFQHTLAQLDDPQHYAAMQQAFAHAHSQWQQNGPLAAVLDLFQNADTWPRLARLTDGDRRIADTRHLLELLHEQAQLNRCTPQALLRWALQQHHGAGDEAVLRLERDDDAVEIVTMHSAKGLQYPVVFVYGAWKGSGTNSKSFPIGVPTPQGTRASFSGDDKETLKQQEEQQLRRLFYVACTRAESHLTIYWPNPIQPEESDKAGNALDGILPPKEAQLRTHPAFIFHKYDNAPLRPWQRPPMKIDLEPPPAPDFAAMRRNSRRLTSYSALTRHSDDDTPWSRWLDEGPSAPVQDNLPAGAVFGQLVHDFLQKTDFQQPDWSRLKTLWQRYGFGKQAPAELRTLLSHTLHGNCDPFALAELPAHRNWREHHFVLHTPRIDSHALDALLGHRPDWAPLPAQAVRGYMQGYIDLIAEHEGRYYILDYKTNRLPAYDPDTLAAAMAEHHYTLQALIYTLAVDAHLRATLPGYDPAQHLGGVRYLFVRGMRTGEQNGVYRIQFTPDELKNAQNALNIKVRQA